MAIVKAPGDSFGATIGFQHRGPAATVWVGIGLAYGIFIGHNPPFCYAMRQVSVANDLDWMPYQVSVTGTIPTNVQLGKLLDAQRFISDARPVVGQQPPNPYGINNWDDEVYASEAAPEVHELIYEPSCAGVNFPLARPYTIDWVRIKLHCTAAASPNKIELRVGDTVVLTRTGITTGADWDQSRDLAPITADRITVACQNCNVSNIHVWFRGV